MWEVALAAPQVVALRYARMIAAGPQPGRRDQAELTRMWSEKVAAFGEGWMAMLIEAWLYPAKLGAAMLRGAPYDAAATPGARALGLALAPVHRKVRANHRRLTRRRRRR